MRSLFLLNLICALNVFASPRVENREFIPLQDRAQGRSLTGSNLLADSLYKNPAASVFNQVYVIDGSFQPPDTASISVLDTKTSALGGALGYFRRPQRPTTTDINGNEVKYPLLEGAKLAVSHKINEWLGAGVGIKTLWGKNNAGVTSRMTDVDVGLLAKYSELYIGLTYANVLGGNENTGLEQNRDISLGARIGWQDTMFFSASASVRPMDAKPLPYEYGFGAEYVSPYYFSLKGGFNMSRPQTSSTLFQSFWTAGASFLTPRLSIHYAVEIPTTSDDVSHVLGATLLM